MLQDTTAVHTACCILLKSVNRYHWFMSAVGAKGSYYKNAGHKQAVQLEHSRGAAVCAAVELQQAGRASTRTQDFLGEGLRLCRKRT